MTTMNTPITPHSCHFHSLIFLLICLFFHPYLLSTYYNSEGSRRKEKAHFDWVIKETLVKRLYNDMDVINVTKGYPEALRG